MLMHKNSTRGNTTFKEESSPLEVDWGSCLDCLKNFAATPFICARCRNFRSLHFGWERCRDALQPDDCPYTLRSQLECLLILTLGSTYDL